MMERLRELYNRLVVALSTLAETGPAFAWKNPRSYLTIASVAGLWLLDRDNWVRLTERGTLAILATATVFLFFSPTVLFWAFSRHLAAERTWEERAQQQLITQVDDLKSKAQQLHDAYDKASELPNELDRLQRELAQVRLEREKPVKVECKTSDCETEQNYAEVKHRLDCRQKEVALLSEMGKAIHEQIIVLIKLPSDMTQTVSDIDQALESAAARENAPLFDTLRPLRARLERHLEAPLLPDPYQQRITVVLQEAGDARDDVKYLVAQRTKLAHALAKLQAAAAIDATQPSLPNP